MFKHIINIHRHFKSLKTIKKLVVLVLISLCNTVYSQNRTSDSLLLALKNAKHDTTKCKILNELVINENDAKTWFGYSNQIKRICEREIVLSRRNKILSKFYKQYLTISLNDIGDFFVETGELVIAQNSYLKSIEIGKKNHDTLRVIKSLNSLGQNYYNQGNTKLALEYFFKSLKLAEIVNDKNGIAGLSINIGSIYNEQNNKDKAIEYYLLGLKKYQEIKDDFGIAVSLNNIGITYSNAEKYSEAFDYLYKSLKIQENLGNKKEIATIINNIAKIFIMKGDSHKALTFYLRSLKLLDEIDEKPIKARVLNNIGTVYLLQKKYKEAFDYSSQSLSLSQHLNYTSDIMSAAETLYKVYKLQNNPAKSLEMHELFIKTQSVLNSEENKKATFKSQFKYEYEKKSLADSLKTGAEKKINNEKLKQERTQRFALYLGLLLVIIFAGFMFNRFKITQKQKNIIVAQKSIVDESQKKMLDSINYAKKIQYSILPSTDEINQYFPNHYIFFQPKDIVSGDFYWFHHQNDLSFFAVADCTGHGVPGAFMTMIAHSILIEVIVEQKLTSPDNILSALHHSVFKTLQQQKGDEYSQDGLDISLCVIDHKNNLLHFSGARNSAYLTDGKDVTMLKATSKSIGGLSLLGEIEAYREFKLEIVDIKKDTLLVLTTDGILDQLNEQDEKFGTNRLKKTILEMYANEPQQNIDLLETTFTDWKKTTHQQDDVLLAGIKF